MTFYNASGYTSFTPDVADYEIGNLFDINIECENGDKNE